MKKKVGILNYIEILLSLVFVHVCDYCVQC